MEASEKPQLQFDSGPDGTVRLLDDRVVIERLEVADRRTSSLIRDAAEAGREPSQTIRDAIEIGARVLEREGLAADVDVARAELEQAAAGLREQFSEKSRELTDRLERELVRVFDGDGGALAQALESHAEELAEQVSRHFDPERQSAVQNQVRELVSKTMQESRDSLIRHLSSDDGANPLADFKAGINRTVVEAVRQLKVEEHATREKLEAVQQTVARLTAETQMAQQVAEAEAAGTRKGRTFEDRVHAAIERIADARGDCALHVGDERGVGGSKKGDTVVEIGAANGPALGRIVFEDKDDQLSRNEAWKELNAAMAERDADFGVLVVAGEQNIPAKREQLLEYEGNKMIVAVDPELPDELGLDLAYRYARLRVVTASDRSLEVDAAGVRDAAEAARSALKRAQSVKLALTGIDKSSAKAREGVEGLVRDVEAELSRIEALVASVADADEALAD